MDPEEDRQLNQQVMGPEGPEGPEGLGDGIDQNIDATTPRADRLRRRNLIQIARDQEIENDLMDRLISRLTTHAVANAGVNANTATENTFVDGRTDPDPVLRENPVEVIETQTEEQNDIEDIVEVEETTDTRNNNEVEETTYDLKIKIENLYKLTQSLGKYNQKDYEEFKSFEDRLRNTINKIFLMSEVDCKFRDVIHGDVKLTIRTENILLIILNDCLDGKAAKYTRSERESNIAIGRFRKIFYMLKESFPDDLGRTYKLALKSIKMLNNESIIEYNARYKSIFHDCIKFKRASEGIGANEDYLNSLPKLPIVQQIRINLSEVIKELSLSKLMQKVASLILQISDGSLVKDKVAYAEKTNYVPQKYRGRSVKNNSSYKRNDKNKKKCKRCGFLYYS